MIESIFYRYEKLLTRDDKITFLHKSLFEAGDDLCKIHILNCLIALENKCITLENIKDSTSIVKLCRDYFERNNALNNWWLMTEGIVYLRLGKYNIDCCNIAKNRFETLLELSDFSEKPSYLMFFLGHVYYEIGKLENDKEASTQHFHQALSCFEAIDYNDTENIYKAMILNMFGNIYVKLENLNGLNEKDYKVSESYYLEALSSYEVFAYPYNGLGNIYRERGRYDTAIHYYKMAANCDEDFMYPWNYMGDCFRYLEKYDLAYNCFRKAIDICNNDNVIFPLYGLGRIYYELGNRNNNNEKYYQKAIEYFLQVEEKAKTNPPQIRFALKDLAHVYQKLGRYEEAIEKYQKILDYQMFNKQKNYDDLVRMDKKICEEKLNVVAKCTISIRGAKRDPANYIMCETFLKGIEGRVNDMKESFEVNFLRREKIAISSFHQLKEDCSDNSTLARFFANNKENNNNMFLEVLRRWNSYTPIIRDGRGGGYFLRINDIGIVIDPGFNFIKNFKDAGHSFSEIDIILISHSHDDHTSDLEALLNLQHRYNKLLKKTILPRDLAKELRISTQEVQNDPKYNDIINDRYLKCKKNLILLTTNGVITKYKGILNKKSIRVMGDIDCTKIMNNHNQDNANANIFYKSLQSGNLIKINEELTVQAIKANHEDLIQGKPCIGFVIELKDEMIVYTGDTGWYNSKKESLQNQYEHIRLQNNRRKKIILIAHLGGFAEKENLYLSDSSDEVTVCDNVMYYKNHLGRLGLVRLIEALQPELCLISEFGEEFNGLRIKIAEIFEEAFSKSNHKTYFLPADIGLYLNLNHQIGKEHIKNIPYIKVISDIDFKNHSILHEYVNADEVSIGEFRDQNSLFYYKKDLTTTEGDCIQAILEGFVDDDEIDGDNLKLDF